MFKKLWKILIVIFIIICIFFPYIYVALASAVASWSPLLATAITGIGNAIAAGQIGAWVTGAVGLGLAYILDPDTTTEVIQAVGNVAAKVVDTAVGVAANAASSVTGKLLPWILGGVALFFVVKKAGDSSKSRDTGQGGMYAQ